MCVEIDKAKANSVRLDKEYHAKSVQFTNVDKRLFGIKKSKQAKIELELSEVQHYEANLLYNIMIINWAYVAMEKFD